MAETQQAPPFDCPNCATSLAAGSPSCSSCGIRLTGPLALRLWHVGQQVDALEREGGALRQRLLAPPDADELRMAGRQAPAPDTSYTPSAPPAGSPASSFVPPGPPPASSLSGQQVLLGIGALLLLAGAAFFLAVVWSLIGVGGQALVMLTLTGLAAAGAVVATRKGLPAAAETAGLIATGLVWLDLTAAHSLGLLGLDRLPSSDYWVGAGLLGAVVLAGFDRLLPRTVDGQPARGMFIYRPAVTTLVCVALWNLLAFTFDFSGTAAAAAALVLTLLSVAVVVAAHVLDRPAPGQFRPSVVPPVLSTGVALVLHVVLAVEAGYTPGSAGERYAAMALLLVIPVLALVLALSPARIALLAGRGGLRASLLLVGAGGVLVAAGVPVMELPREAVSLLSVPLAVGAALLLWRPVATVTPRGVLAGWMLVGIGGLFWLGWVLELGGAATALELQSGRYAPAAAVWVAALPAFACAVAAGTAAYSRRSVVWTACAQGAALLGLWGLLRDSGHEVVLLVTLLVAVGHVAAAAVARWVHREVDADGFELLGWAGALLTAVVALAAAGQASPVVQASTWLLLGAVVLSYAGLPGRLESAYLGAFLVPVGVGILLADQEVTVLEAYTVSAVVLLAAIGAVQWARRPDAPTMLTMGPALTVGLLPSLFAGIAGDEFVRLALVTLVGLGLLVVGFSRKWQAPVLFGAGVLLAVAVTQGGPLVEYVPNFILMMAAGGLALTVGVAWEVAVSAGRRGIVWLGALR